MSTSQRSSVTSAAPAVNATDECWNTAGSDFAWWYTRKWPERLAALQMRDARICAIATPEDQQLPRSALYTVESGWQPWGGMRGLGLEKRIA
jgi:hypothetical protein